MEIGTKEKEVTTVPRPVPIRRIPNPVIPVREPAPVRAPVRKARLLAGGSGLVVEEIPYVCPECRRALEVEDGVVYCPVHGVIEGD